MPHQNDEEKSMKLIFVADPMCSWCYGFGKELTELRESFPALPLDIVVGGLRAGATDVLTTEQKQFRLGHWARVEEASGLPFNREAFLALKNFVYDTEPVCRAVVTARKQVPGIDQLAVFRAIQQGFYVAGRDTTSGTVLASLGADAMTAQGHATSAESFLSTWQDPETIAEARADFAKARGWGITSFPALLLEANGQMYSISPGYTDAATLRSRLHGLLASLTVPA
jgi:putative protein-disulfide isomerase